MRRTHNEKLSGLVIDSKTIRARDLCAVSEADERMIQEELGKLEDGGGLPLESVSVSEAAAFSDRYAGERSRSSKK